MTTWISVILFIIICLSFTKTIDIYMNVCERMCVCEERDNISITSCENQGIISLSEIRLLNFKVHHLFLTGNLLDKLSFDEFVHYEGLEILHLGNNDIVEIEAGAFNGLNGLKCLRLNNNKIKALRSDMFVGLKSLVYLQMDYNYISSIEPNTFDTLRCLEILILNDNLLSSLPKNLFYFLALTHLDLRGNKFKVLPYKGLLEHLNKLVEIQIEENYWNCSCGLIDLRNWLESRPYTVLAGNVVCEMPLHLHGKKLDEIRKQELCPRRARAEYKITPKSFYEPQATRSYTILQSTQPTKSLHHSRKLHTMPTLKTSTSRPQNYGPMVANQTKSPLSFECPTACNCNLQILDRGLNVNCQERKIERISDLNPKPYNPKKMYLTGNYIHSVYSTDFLDTTSLDLLHLGNNRISIIQNKAFAQLHSLRRLYLNGNLIKRLFSYIFYGLESLQFLYLEYNSIMEIETGTFEQLTNLHLLFLNNNYLKVLPSNIFTGMSLMRLNLRNNNLQNLPLGGVLEYLTSLVQIDLYENPWNCSCSILEMKTWLKELKDGSIVNKIICESPLKLMGEDLRYVQPSYLCPNDSDVQVSVVLPSEETFPGSTITLEMTLDYSSLENTIPLSVTILTLILIIIVSIFMTAGMFTMSAMKRRITVDCKICDMVYSEQQPGTKVQTSASHIYEYVPPAPISSSVTYGTVEEKLKDFDEVNTTLASNSDEELGNIVNSSEFSTSNRPSPLIDDNFFYRDILERHHQPSDRSTSTCKHGASLYSSTPDFDGAHTFLHPESIRQMMMYVEPNRGEYWELNTKFNFEPNYLEIHEKRTTFSQF